MSREVSNKAIQSQIEREAIERLSRQFRPSLKRYFAKRCKEAEEIDDLVQEVFLRLVKRSAVTDVERINGCMNIGAFPRQRRAGEQASP